MSSYDHKVGSGALSGESVVEAEASPDHARANPTPYSANGPSELEPPSINSLSLTEQSGAAEEALIKATTSRDVTTDELLLRDAQAESEIHKFTTDLNNEPQSEARQDDAREVSRIHEDSNSEQGHDDDGIITVTVSSEERASVCEESLEQDLVRQVSDELTAIMNDVTLVASKNDDNKPLASVICARIFQEFTRLFLQGWEREDSPAEAQAPQTSPADPAVRFAFLEEVYLEFVMCVSEYLEHRDHWYVQEVRTLLAKVKSPGYSAVEKFFNNRETSAFTDAVAEILVQYLPEEWPQAPTLTVPQAKELHRAIVEADVKVKYNHINQFITYFARLAAGVDKSELAKEFEISQDKNYPLFESQNTVLASYKPYDMTRMRWSLDKMANAGATVALRAELGLEEKDEADTGPAAVLAKLEQLGYPNEGVSSPIGKLVADLLRHFGPRLEISSALELAKVFDGILQARHKGATDPPSERSFECSLEVEPPNTEEG